MPPAELAKSCIAKWRSFVARSLAAERISIVDGQLFHGNLTTLDHLIRDLRAGLWDLSDDLTARYLSHLSPSRLTSSM